LALTKAPILVGHRSDVKRLIPSGIAMPAPRTPLLIRCSSEDAARVRYHSALDHRSISGYLLYVLERNLTIEERFADGVAPFVVARNPVSLASRRSG
jgi:hypothetical protein